MLKLISILLTNGIVLFMLISCHNKTGNSKSTVNLEYENSIDSLNSYKMDISHFINSIEPGETIVEEKQMHPARSCNGVHSGGGLCQRGESGNGASVLHGGQQRDWRTVTHQGDYPRGSPKES